jgi:predicted TIM-barrel fold metal-dependent hydrolase
VIDAVGIDKIIFGSDYPLKLFPRHQKEAGMQPYINYVFHELDLTYAEQQAILVDNFVKIFPGGF